MIGLTEIKGHGNLIGAPSNEDIEEWDQAVGTFLEEIIEAGSCVIVLEGGIKDYPHFDFSSLTMQ